MLISASSCVVIEYTLGLGSLIPERISMPQSVGRCGGNISCSHSLNTSLKSKYSRGNGATPGMLACGTIFQSPPQAPGSGIVFHEVAGQAQALSSNSDCQPIISLGPTCPTSTISVMFRTTTKSQYLPMWAYLQCYSIHDVCGWLALQQLTIHLFKTDQPC